MYIQHCHHYNSKHWDVLYWIHKHVNKYVRTYVWTHMHANTHTHTHTHARAHFSHSLILPPFTKHVHKYAYTYVHTSMHILTYVHTYIRTYTCKQICTYKDSYTATHLCHFKEFTHSLQSCWTLPVQFDSFLCLRFLHLKKFLYRINHNTCSLASATV